MAPLYDLVCTEYYTHLSNTMAMKIGGEYASAKIAAKHWEKFAEEAGLSALLAKQRLLSLASALLKSLSPSGEVQLEIAERIRLRCEETLALVTK